MSAAVAEMNEHRAQPERSLISGGVRYKFLPTPFILFSFPFALVDPRITFLIFQLSPLPKL